MDKIISTSVALALLLATPACNSGPQTGNSVDAAGNAADAAFTSPTPTKDAPSASGASVGETEVRNFLAGVYAPYSSDATHDTDFEKILEPRLASAVLNTEGGPEADPFIDAQDYVPFRPVYENVQVSGNRATATVRFTNVDTPKRIDYERIRTPAGWRVYDVRSADGGSLRKRFLNPAR